MFPVLRLRTNAATLPGGAGGSSPRASTLPGGAGGSSPRASTLPGGAGGSSPRASTVRRGAFGGLAVITGLVLAACSSSSSSSNPLTAGGSKGVVVGSANFPENELLAEIYVLALQAKGVKVTSKFNIGSREVYYPEVKNGTITIIPEYNGALLTTSVDTTSSAATTAEVDAALTSKLPSTLEILNSSAAQDKDSVTVTQATATKDHLTSIADLKPYAGSFVFGGPPEFKTRADGLAGL